MTAIPLWHGIEPPLHSLADGSSTSSICHYDTKTSENDNNVVGMNSVCCNDAAADCSSVKQTAFITGPEDWPAHLQLKVGTTFTHIC